MYCRKCGTKISDSANFCRVCGQTIRTVKKDNTWPHSKRLSKASLHRETAPLPSELIQIGYEGDSNNWKYWGAGISVVILILAGIWFAIDYGSDSDDSNGDVHTDSDDTGVPIPTGSATLHIQFTSWETEDQGQDSGSLPDPWIRVGTVNGKHQEYQSSKIWTNTLEWYGALEFEFGIEENSSFVGIAIELYDSDGPSTHNPRIGESQLMDIDQENSDPENSDLNKESRRIAFWYNFTDPSCITAFTLQSDCEEGNSLSSGLPRHNEVEISADGKLDGKTDEFDSRVNFVVWWGVKNDDSLPEEFYTDDHDGDGVVDYLDYNDNMDMGITITLKEFGIATNYDEYMNVEVFIDGDSRYKLGQTGDSILIQGGNGHSFDENFFFDIDDSKEYSVIQIAAYSTGWLFTSNFDLNGNADHHNILTVFFYTHGEIGENYNKGYADGREDTGNDFVTDAFLNYTIEITDTASIGEQRNFEWEYDGKIYTHEININQDVYYAFKALEHDVSDEWDWPAGYARFTTPDEQYVINLAQDLNGMAVSEGFTDLETANFILSFVQTIDYKPENYSNYQGIQDYPKYPVEMLWDGQGDCEDSSALYASLMEALGYDVVLLLFLGDVIGHAAIGISVSGATGKSYEYGGVDYYYAETTDTGPSIGLDPALYFPELDTEEADFTYDVPVR